MNYEEMKELQKILDRLENGLSVNGSRLNKTELDTALRLLIKKAIDDWYALD